MRYLFMIKSKYMRIQMFSLLFEKIVNLSFENFDGLDVLTYAMHLLTDAGR